MNHLIQKYNNLTLPAKASLWFIVSNIILKGLSFFTLPIFSRLLTTNEYGIVSVYSSWVATISIITTLTIWGGVFNVGMVKFSDRREELISSFQGLAVSITILIATICLSFIESFSTILGLSNFLTVCLFVEILSQIPLNIWITEQRYLFKYKMVIFITIINAVLSPLIGIILVLNSDNKAEAKIISNMLVNLIVAIALFYHNQHRGKSFFNKIFWKFGFGFNIILVPHYLSTQVLNQSDRIMINSICGSSDAGIYSVAYNFAMLLTIITNGINSSLTPHIYQTLKSGDTFKLKKQTTSIIFLVALMTLGFICAIPDVFNLLLPQSYQEALLVIPPVTVGTFFLFLYPLFGSVEFYFEENRYVTIASVSGAVLNVLLNFVFIKIYGFIAAAYTTLICYICFAICHYYFMKFVLKKNNQTNTIYDTKFIIIISVILLATSILLIPVYNNILWRWGAFLAILFLILLSKNRLKFLLKELRK